MQNRPLTLLLDFDDQARRDQGQTSLFLHRRDRRYALDCENRDEKPTTSGWLQHVNADRRPQSGPDARLRGWRKLGRWTVPIAAILGAFTMPGLLFYDGKQQINITIIIAFVALQLLLALGTTLQAVLGWQPWGRLLSPFRTETGSRTSLYRLQPQLAACTAHRMALAFTLTAWVTLLVLVVVQDLAFGWSTTLRTSTDSYFALINALATPWQWIWPAAAPSPELVVQTQFYRLQEGVQGNIARYGDWWRFVAALWLTYAVLPRVILLALAHVHLRVRANRLLRAHPAWPSLQQRMSTAAVDTGSELSENEQPTTLAHRKALQPLPEAGLLVRWAEAGESESQALSNQLDVIVRSTLSAGGAASLAQDEACIDQIINQNDPVILMARAWEPPTGELADFLEDIRDRWRKARVVALLPIGHGAPPGAATAGQIAQWQRFAARQNDANLWVCTPPGQTVTDDIPEESRHG